MNHIPFAVRIQATLLVLTGGALVTAPRAAPLFAFLVPALLLAFHVERPRLSGWQEWRASPTVAAIGAFLALAFVSAAWAPLPEVSITRVGITISIVAAMLVGAIVISTVSARGKVLLAGWLFVGFCAGLLYLLHEVITNQTLLLWLVNTFPEMRLNSSMWKLAEGRVIEVHPANLRWNITTINILQWALLLIVTLLWSGRTRWMLSGAVFAGVALVTVLSQDMTSKIAFGVAVLVFGIATVVPKFSSRFMMVAWAIAVLGAIPITHTAASMVRSMDIDVGSSFGQRVVMWEFIGTEVQKRPLLGLGATASGSRLVERQRATESLQEAPADDELKKQPLPHPHNIFLQVWYELGLLGASLFLLVGLALIRSIARGPPIAVPYLLAGFSAAMIIGCAKWDMWQTWYQSTLALLFLSWLAAVRLAPNGPSGTADVVSFEKIAFPPAIHGSRLLRRTAAAVLGSVLLGIATYWAYVLSVRIEVDRTIAALARCISSDGHDGATAVNGAACHTPAEQLARLFSGTDASFATSGWAPVSVYVSGPSIVAFEPGCRTLGAGHQILRVIVRHPAPPSPQADAQLRATLRLDFNFSKADADKRRSRQFTHSTDRGCLAMGLLDRVDYQTITFGPFETTTKTFLWTHTIRTGM